MAEYRRLLYVAMTRAEDRLYVCGWQRSRKPPDECWHQLIRDGLSELDGVEEKTIEFAQGDGWLGSGLHLSCPQTVAAEPPARPPPPMADIAQLKSIFREPAPSEPRPPRPLAPSRRLAAPPPLQGPLEGRGESAFLRGRLIHRLLELLPEEAPGDRAAAARRFLARPLYALDEATRGRIEAEVMAVLEDDAAAPLFGPRSQAEVPLAAVIGKHVVSGQVDRLLVEENRVLVVDFKSGRASPEGDSAIAEAYLTQMADYRAVLRAIFPGREIRCALLFTDGPALVWLADTLLDGHSA
jgi:ATP-dependent helicase/nuclease subunit A